MSKLIAMAVMSLAFAAVHAGEKDSEWVSLFNGKDLTGWKAGDAADSFVVEDGAIVTRGKPKSHLFYAGPVNGGVFTNFELAVDVLSEPNSNGGVYFHTEFQQSGWPEKGFEVQVNNTYNDKRRTGSLYGVDDVFEAPAKDGEWFNLHTVVNGNRVTVRVDGRTVVDWTQPEGFQGLNEKKEGQPYFPLRKLDRGTFALQCHDPKSVIYYKNIRVKVLP